MSNLKETKQQKRNREAIENNRQFYNSLAIKPKTSTLSGTPMQSLTATLSYCRHTNVKIAMGTSFKNSSTARKNGIVAGQHPIFDLPLPLIYKIYHESNTPTEKYIAMVAFLVESKILLTRHSGLHLDTKQFLKAENKFKKLLPLLSSYIHDTKTLTTLNLPMLSISEVNYDSGDAIATHIDICIDMIHALTANYFTQDIELSLRTAYSNEALLTKELKTLANYKTKDTTIQRNKINKWALERLQANTEYEPNVIAFISYQMFSPSEKLKAENIHQALKLIKDGLTFEEHEADSSNMVLRLLELKLDDIKIAANDFGFSIVDAEISDPINNKLISTTKGHINGFGKDMKIKTRRPLGTNALARLKNKFEG